MKKILEELIKEGNEVLDTGYTRKTSRNSLYLSPRDLLDEKKYIGWRTSCLRFLKTNFGSQDVYYLEFDKEVKSKGLQRYVKLGIGILENVLKDVERGII